MTGNHPKASDRPSLDGFDWSAVQRSLRAFLRSRGLSPADVDDVLQDTFVRVVNGLPQLRASGAFDAFVFRTARNALADHFRRAPRDRPGAEPFDADEPESSVSEILAQGRAAAASGEDDDESTAAIAALARWLRWEIDHLPEPMASTLRRTEIDGMSYRAVAEADGVSLSAIKSRVSRGRQVLKARLLKCCSVELDARHRVQSYAVRLDDEPCGCHRC